MRFLVMHNLFPKIYGCLLINEIKEEFSIYFTSRFYRLYRFIEKHFNNCINSFLNNCFLNNF